MQALNTTWLPRKTRPIQFAFAVAATQILHFHGNVVIISLEQLPNYPAYPWHLLSFQFCRKNRKADKRKTLQTKILGLCFLSAIPATDYLAGMEHQLL